MRFLAGGGRKGRSIGGGGMGGHGVGGSGRGGRGIGGSGMRGRGVGGRGMGGFAAGPSGYCVCPNCGTRIAHQRGESCLSMICPECGSTMVREGTANLSPTDAGEIFQDSKALNSDPQRSGSQRRSSGRSQRRVPQVDESKCTGCQNCMPMCPFHAIAVENGIARIDADRCAGCLNCVNACPVGAIGV